jgi:hypothetical protein
MTFSIMGLMAVLLLFVEVDRPIVAEEEGEGKLRPRIARCAAATSFSVAALAVGTPVTGAQTAD